MRFPALRSLVSRTMVCRIQGQQHLLEVAGPERPPGSVSGGLLIRVDGGLGLLALANLVEDL